MKMKPAQSVSSVRIIVQWVFLTWIIGIGVRFGIFVNGVEQGNGAPLFSRPPGVEGFLPIGALTSLKYWLVSGEIHPVHPAALVIFLAILLMSVLAKKSFCSWLCPVGTLSEGAYRLGCRIFGRNFRVWRWLDITLRGIKYLLLIFFVKIILIDMPNEALGSFLDAPYWAVSDIKMLRFFTRMTMTTAVVLLMLTGLSLIYENFWCRYLCPYGALLGLASMASPFRVRRDPDACIGCRRCYGGMSFPAGGTCLSHDFFPRMHRLPDLRGELPGTLCPCHAAGVLATAAAGLGIPHCGTVAVYGSNRGRHGQRPLAQFSRF